MRHCDTSRKVAGSIPDGVTGIFHWHNPSVRTMALGSKGGRCVRLTTLPPSCTDSVAIWEPKPTGTLRACPGLGMYRDCFKLKLLFHDVDLSGQGAGCIWCVPRRCQSAGMLNNNIMYLFTVIGLSPGGSGYFTCKQYMKLVTNKFKSGGLHEKHVVATWNVGNHLSICL